MVGGQRSGVLEKGSPNCPTSPGYLVGGVRDCCFAAQGLLDEVHRPHAAHVVGVAYKLPAWGVQADFAAVTSHPAAIGLASFRLSWFVFVALTVRGIVIDAVVVLTQHR